MKVLLCKDIDKLGYLGDIVDVKDGYARNYLLPCNLATVPNEVNIKALAEEKAKRAAERKLVYQQLEKAAAAVEGAEAVLMAKANEQGHLFGSVTEHDIAENLRSQGFEVADDMVALDGHIKEVGTHEVTLKMASDLIANVSVVVVSDSPDTAEALESTQDEEIESADKDNQG